MLNQTICTIVPPHILEKIIQNGTHEEQIWARKNLQLSHQLREQRHTLIANTKSSDNSQKQRNIYDANHTQNLPGSLIRSEADKPTIDQTANEAYDGTGAMYDLYFDIYQRNSIDNHGLPLISTVHYLQNYDNAFWNGEQMVYGDGDGKIFNQFTKSVDITGHELTHGVTQYTANLDYQDEPGALNESFSDVFGSLVKQRTLNQTADQADWLIGAGIFTSKIHGIALRSLKAPGTAYDDPILGKDPQPARMDDYKPMTDDNGGVHINSGIPNHAFYLTAIAIGGYAWEKTGKIWYQTLTKEIIHTATFQECANATYETAQKLYGQSSSEAQAVKSAWNQVGIA